jgi:BCD family chlorophyll transporter-like MFS transporter
MVATYAYTRRWPPHRQWTTTAWGLALLGLPLVLLALTALFRAQALILPVLLFFGVGFGVFTVGGVSLLMAMSGEEQAGSYLALWSVIQLVARGAGIAAGGGIRDLALALSGSFNVAYATVFAVESLGLFAAIWLLLRVGVPDMSGEQTQRHAAGSADQGRDQAISFDYEPRAARE